MPASVSHQRSSHWSAMCITPDMVIAPKELDPFPCSSHRMSLHREIAAGKRLPSRGDNVITDVFEPDPFALKSPLVITLGSNVSWGRSHRRHAPRGVPSRNCSKKHRFYSIFVGFYLLFVCLGLAFTVAIEPSAVQNDGGPGPVAGWPSWYCEQQQ